MTHLARSIAVKRLASTLRHRSTRNGQGCGLLSWFSPPFIESKKPASSSMLSQRRAVDGCCADDYGVQVAQVPTLRSPGARPMPTGHRHQGKSLFSCGYTPHVHLLCFPTSYITTCLPDGGDFLVLKLEVLLLLRSTLITKLSSVETTFCACARRNSSVY
jgi:hypothetical protein